MKYLYTLILLISTFTFGCSCIQSTIEDNYKTSNAIFIGKVISIDSTKYDYSSNPVYAYTFEFIEDFKRELPKENSKKYYTTIYTPLGNLFGGCGSTFRLNETYLVYGYKTSVGVSTNICTRTDVLSNVSKDEINKLKKFKEKNKNSLDIPLQLYENDDKEILSKEFELYKLTSEKKEKYYLISLSVLGILLIISLFFNFRKRK